MNKLEEDFVTLLRLSLDNKREDVRLFARRKAWRNRNKSPEFSAAIHAILIGHGEGMSILREEPI